jgi:hypothetical protein
MRIFLLFPFLACFIFSTVHAEYRVFVLKISKPNPEQDQPPISRTVQSSLDPIQYRDLYPVQPDESIVYTDTWRCKGRTDNILDYCAKPGGTVTQNKAQIPDSSVSNQNTP